LSLIRRRLLLNRRIPEPEQVRRCGLPFCVEHHIQKVVTGGIFRGFRRTSVAINLDRSAIVTFRCVLNWCEDLLAV
jgi:hypothetical protein